MDTDNIATEHFLVYGTLRPGCGNYDRYFPNFIHSVKTVRIPGFAMVKSKFSPYAVRATQEDSIECSLIAVTDTESNLTHLVGGLDMLEGCLPSDNPKTQRITVPVNGVDAHLYVSRDDFHEAFVTSLPRVESGNWHDVITPNDVAFMWVFHGEDSNLVPDDSVEPRFLPPTDEEGNVMERFQDMSFLAP